MPTKPGTYATLKTSEGTILCELFEKHAPQTVANFIGLAEGTKEWTSRSKKGPKLYDGTVFHRVIPGFMIQGGDPKAPAWAAPVTSSPTRPRARRTASRSRASWPWPTPGPNTNGSQFFITVADTSWLTGKHTIFGEVVEGYEIVEKISNVPTGSQDRPRTPVLLETVTIERIG